MAAIYLLSHVQLFVTPWTVAHPFPLSMGFPRQEYWSGLPFPPPGDPPDPGIKPTSLVWQADSLPLNHLGSPFLFYRNSHAIIDMPNTYTTIITLADRSRCLTQMLAPVLSNGCLASFPLGLLLLPPSMAARFQKEAHE